MALFVRKSPTPGHARMDHVSMTMSGQYNNGKRIFTGLSINTIIGQRHPDGAHPQLSFETWICISTKKDTPWCVLYD